MPTIYQKACGEILSQRIDSYLSADDMLSCRDELVLQQSVLEDRVEEYSTALQSGERGNKAAWGSLVNEGAKEVIASKEKMAKIDQWRAQHITRETLFMMVRSIADMLYQTFAVDESSTEKVADMVASIEAAVLGTSTNEVTEGDLFNELFQSVPQLEYDESTTDAV